MRVFPVADVVDAFRHMAQAKHIGKIVVSLPVADHPKVAPRVDQSSIVRPDATYLITGGLSGLGLRVAQWFVERGARHLVLLARSVPSSAAQRIIDELGRAGAHVAVRSGDVSNRDDVARLLDEIHRKFPVLRGVIHSAGVLDDGVILRQDWGRFVAVLGPKVAGAWLLHTLTEQIPLDSFVLFSSISALLGSAGLSNHAAANAFLDALAHHRRALGLAALSVNWGAWSEIGCRRGARIGVPLKARGIGSFSAAARPRRPGVLAAASRAPGRRGARGLVPIRSAFQAGNRCDAFLL